MKSLFIEIKPKNVFRNEEDVLVFFDGNELTKELDWDSCDVGTVCVYVVKRTHLRGTMGVVDALKQGDIYYVPIKGLGAIGLM